MEVAYHMTHSLRTASTYYREKTRPTSAATTGGFLQDILQGQESQTSSGKYSYMFLKTRFGYHVWKKIRCVIKQY
jgi:hypothetical protein